ncbi:MAG: hypothetical protein K2Y37_19755 [Pirellulales bacterium]|nr:hypothetical protein [Pirellulales bacterium]
MSQPPAPQSPGRNPWQFSLATLLWVTVLLSVLLAFLGGVLRTQGREATLETMLFRLALIAAPLAILVLVSVVRALLDGVRRIRSRDR